MEKHFSHCLMNDTSLFAYDANMAYKLSSSRIFTDLALIFCVTLHGSPTISSWVMHCCSYMGVTNTLYPYGLLLGRPCLQGIFWQFSLFSEVCNKSNMVDARVLIASMSHTHVMESVCDGMVYCYVIMMSRFHFWSA